MLPESRLWLSASPGAVHSLDPRKLAGVGIVVLLLTPVGRVAAALLHFAHHRDRLYTALTGLVLANLAIAVAISSV